MTGQEQNKFQYHPKGCFAAGIEAMQNQPKAYDPTFPVPCNEQIICEGGESHIEPLVTPGISPEELREKIKKLNLSIGIGESIPMKRLGEDNG